MLWSSPSLASMAVGAIYNGQGDLNRWTIECALFYQHFIVTHVRQLAQGVVMAAKLETNPNSLDTNVAVGVSWDVPEQPIVVGAAVNEKLGVTADLQVSWRDMVFRVFGNHGQNVATKWGVGMTIVKK